MNEELKKAGVGDERTAFEAWRLAKFCGGAERLKKCGNAPGVYYYTAEQEAWSAWNAALDSVVVKLPEPHYEFDGDPAPEMMASDVIKAIHAAGLKTA